MTEARPHSLRGRLHTTGALSARSVWCRRWRECLNSGLGSGSRANSSSSRRTTHGSRICAARWMRICGCSNRASTCRSAVVATLSVSAVRARRAPKTPCASLFDLAKTEEVTPERVHLALRERESGAGAARASPLRASMQFESRAAASARAATHQRDYLAHIRARDLTFGIGPAGTGKTYLAVACAVEACSRTACAASCWCGRPWKPASGWVSCRGT